MEVEACLLRRDVEHWLRRPLGLAGRYLVRILAQDSLDAGDFVAIAALLAFFLDLVDELRHSVLVLLRRQLPEGR